MNYIAYKLSFHTGVHFGDGILSHSRQNFCADTLFSALCIEALRLGPDGMERLYEAARAGRLLFSDGFPFVGEALYVPKPLLSVEHKSEDIADRKKWKKLSYIPIEKIGEFLSGGMDIERVTEKTGSLGKEEVRQLVSLQNEEKSEPYSVGVYHFFQGNGLYFILGYESEDDRRFVGELVRSLGVQGFGGKVSSGLGKFLAEERELPAGIAERMSGTGRLMALTTSLPRQAELGVVLAEAAYLLSKRSGFIQSDRYADELVKKRDMYFLRAGSVVYHRYEGDVYTVGTKGRHPVWRYGKPILMEV